MGRSPCCDKVGLKKGPWTPEEDQKLLAYIEEHGHGSWRSLPAKAGLQRCGKSCRLRWTNYLRPDIKRGKFNLQEEQTIIQLHALLGNRWSAIATHLPKRTDNEIKNYWNTHLKKRLTKMGIDPITHKPKNDGLLSNYGQSKNSANLSHMAQWESARLEAEARLVRESKLKSNPFQHHNHLLISPGSTLALNKPPLRSSIGLDLESPNSTLSFSGNGQQVKSMAVGESYTSAAVIDFVGNSAICEDNEGIIKEEGDEEAWKLGFSCLTDVAMSIESTWTPESLRNSANGHGFMEGFTKLLLSNDSTEQNSSDGGRGGSSDGGDHVDNNDGEAGSNSDAHEDNKKYWTAIFDMVYSSPSNSPMF